MESRTHEISQSQLLHIANMAFGVAAGFRNNIPRDEMAENVEWLEYALEQAFGKGDPFISGGRAEAEVR